MPTNIDKKHYQVGKKLPTWILYGTQIQKFQITPRCRLEHLSLLVNTVKTHSFPRPQTGNQYPLAIIYNFIADVFHTVAKASSIIFDLRR